MSLPVRECGLKYYRKTDTDRQERVTPCAGVWIEILKAKGEIPFSEVTPCAGVWIEIIIEQFSILILFVSLPVRECGLK